MQTSDVDFKKLAIWESKQKLNFGSQAIFAVLCTEVGSQIEIDLAQISIDYASEIIEMSRSLNPGSYQNHDYEPLEKIDSRRREILIKGFKQLQKLGFLKVLASQNWKQHTVKINPVWEQENKF